MARRSISHEQGIFLDNRSPHRNFTSRLCVFLTMRNENKTNLRTGHSKALRDFSYRKPISQRNDFLLYILVVGFFPSQSSFDRKPRTPRNGPSSGVRNLTERFSLKVQLNKSLESFVGSNHHLEPHLARIRVRSQDRLTYPTFFKLVCTKKASDRRLRPARGTPRKDPPPTGGGGDPYPRVRMTRHLRSRLLMP